MGASGAGRVHPGTGLSHAAAQRAPAREATLVVFSDDFDRALASFVIAGGSAGPALGAAIGIPSFVLMVAISALEILVAGIQAYVFALLTSLYINDAENLH